MFGFDLWECEFCWLFICLLRWAGVGNCCFDEGRNWLLWNFRCVVVFCLKVAKGIGKFSVLRWGFYLAAYMLYWMQIWLKHGFCNFRRGLRALEAIWLSVWVLGFELLWFFLYGWWFLSVGHYSIVAWLSRFVCSVRRMTVIVSFMVLLLYDLAVAGSLMVIVSRTLLVGVRMLKFDCSEIPTRM